MSALDLWLKFGAAVAVEIALLYLIAKVATRFIVSAHWQRTIWQAAIVSMCMACAGEVNGVRALIAPAPGSSPAVTVTIAPIDFQSAAAPEITEPPVAVEVAPVYAEPQQFAIAPVLRWCWMGGVLLLLLRMIVAILFTFAFRMAAERVTHAGLISCVELLRALLGLRRRVSLRQTGRVFAPFTFGVIRPVIVLPRRFTAMFNPDQQKLALLHELAHIGGFDAVWRLVANLLCVIFWWHPLVWMTRRELSHASEAAADEASLSVENGPGRLAECLLECARQLRPAHRHLWIGMGGFHSSIGKRIERLMELSGPSRPVGRRASWTTRLAAPAVTVLLIWGVAAVIVPPAGRTSWRESLAAAVWDSTAQAAPPASSNAINPVESAATPPRAATAPHHSPQREKIYEKLRMIRLANLSYDRLPLSEVVKTLSEAVRKKDPAGSGISFLIADAPESSSSIAGVIIRISEPLRNVTVEETLNVIALVAETKLTWRVEDFGVVISPRSVETVPLHTRFFKLDGTNFWLELEARFGEEVRGTGAHPGQDPATRVPLVKRYFSSLGLDLDEPGKTVFLNDRVGHLMVRATLEDLGAIEAAIRPFGNPSASRPATDVPMHVELRVRMFEVPTNVKPKNLLSPVPGSKPAEHVLVGVLTEQQGHASANFERTAAGRIFPPIIVASGRQAHFDLSSKAAQPEDSELLDNARNGKSAHLTSLDVIPYIQTNGVVQLTTLPTLTEFLGYSDPQPDLPATGGPYAPENRFGFRSPAISSVPPLPRFRLRQVASTSHVFDGQTLIIDRTAGAWNGTASSTSLVCFITARIVDVEGKPVRTAEEVRAFTTIPAQPAAVTSLNSRPASRDGSSKGQPTTSEISDSENIQSKPAPGGTNAATDRPPTPEGAPQLYTRFFNVDPTTFAQGMSSIVTRDPKTGGIKQVMPERDFTNDINVRLLTFFKSVGADFDGAGKSILFNQKVGALMVRGTLRDLDAVERAVQFVNIAPPQLVIEVKASEVPLRAIREGFVKLPKLSETARITAANSTSSNPPIRAATTVITRAQYSAVLRSIEDVAGADVLSVPPVTTLSGRQAQIKVVDVRYVVTDLDYQTNGAPTKSHSWWPFGRRRVGKGDIRPIAEPFEIGPIIDVVPRVEADGRTIQMTVLPTLREFLGYDDPGIFQAENGGTVSPTPLPKFRLRQVTASARVWDGQTLVIGAGQAPAKDGTPRELIFFITPRLIDAAGNPLHREDDLDEPAQATSTNGQWIKPVWK